MRLDILIKLLYFRNVTEETMTGMNKSIEFKASMMSNEGFFVGVRHPILLLERAQKEFWTAVNQVILKVAAVSLFECLLVVFQRSLITKAVYFVHAFPCERCCPAQTPLVDGSLMNSWLDACATCQDFGNTPWKECHCCNTVSDTVRVSYYTQSVRFRHAGEEHKWDIKEKVKDESVFCHYMLRTRKLQ